MANVRAELRVNDKGHQELWNEGQLLGTFNGRTGWVMSERFERHPVGNKRTWDAGVKMHGAQPEPMKRQAPSKPRALRAAAEPEPIATAPTLLEAIKAREVPLGELTGHNEAWIVYQHLEDVLSEFGLTFRAAEYYDIVHVVNRHPGQPRMGKALDGKWRMLKVEVLREPPLPNPTYDEAGNPTSIAELNLQFVLRYYRGEVFGKWLDHLLSTTFNHGSKLVEMLGDTGMTDNAHAADKLLAAAEKEGWIAKAGDTPTPTAQQRFTGVGGLKGDSSSIGYHGQVWGWAPGERSPEAQDWLSRFEWSSFRTDDAEETGDEQQPKSKWGSIFRLRTLVGNHRAREADKLQYSAGRAGWERIKVTNDGSWYLCNRELGLIAFITFGGPEKEARVFNWATTKWANTAAGWPKCEAASQSERPSPISVLPRRAPLSKKNQDKSAVAFQTLVNDAGFDASDPMQTTNALRTYWASIGGFLVEDGAVICRERWSIPTDPTGTTRVIRCTRDPKGKVQNVLISTESGSNRSAEPAPAALARVLRPRLNILDADAFEKLTALEGASWAAEERAHADEAGRFLDAQDAYRILKDGGLADTHDLAEVADSPGFVGAEGEIYVIDRQGDIVLFGDTASASKAKAAARVLRVIGQDRPTSTREDSNIGRSWKSLQGTKTITGKHDSAHYLVSVEGESAFQLVVPKKDIEEEIDFDRLAVESRQKTIRESLEAEDIDAAKKLEDKDTRGWTDSMPPFKHARILNVLNGTVQSGGRFTTRKKLIESRTDQDWTVKIVNDERRLVSPDGNIFLGEDQITKIGMDYAQYLAGLSSGSEAEKVLPYARGRSVDDVLTALSNGYWVEVSESTMRSLSKTVADKGTNIRTRRTGSRWQVSVLNPEKLKMGSNPFDAEDTFGTQTVPVIKSGRHMVIEKLKEEPSFLAANRLVKPSIIDKLEQPAVHHFSRSRAWMLVTPDEATARKVAASAHKNLLGKRSLTASDPQLHDKKLYVTYPDGFIEVEPLATAVKPAFKLKSDKDKLVDRGRDIFGKRGFSVHGKKGTYVMQIRPTARSFRGKFSTTSVKAETIEQLEQLLNKALEKLGKES